MTALGWTLGAAVAHQSGNWGPLLSILGWMTGSLFTCLSLRYALPSFRWRHVVSGVLCWTAFLAACWITVNKFAWPGIENWIDNLPRAKLVFNFWEPPEIRNKMLVSSMIELRMVELLAGALGITFTSAQVKLAKKAQKGRQQGT
jgi:hypothetical protein